MVFIFAEHLLRQEAESTVCLGITPLMRFSGIFTIGRGEEKLLKWRLLDM